MGDNKSETKLPDGVTLSGLTEKLNLCNTEYSKAFNRARKLDAADKGKLWKAVQAKYPKYQILPETNHVSYIKNNILASIYTVGKSAELIPTSKEDKDIIVNLNIALEHIWDMLDVPYYQFQAGERAALLNIGITQVGWDNSIMQGTADNFIRGNVSMKNIDPLKFMRDPYAKDLETSAYCVTWEDYHKSIILANENYKDNFRQYLQTHHWGSMSETTITAETDKVSSSAVNKKDYYRVYTWFIRNKKTGKISEIHTVNNEAVLMVKNEIKPNMFPFAILYCNLPAGDLFGTSEPNKIFANSLAYNIMSSIIATAEYKNQRPPRFINNQSGINVAAFTKHGNDADHTFVVQGDATKAVSYHQYPQPTQAAYQLMGIMGNDIKSITGVDDRYTGRDTGSVLTTGGIESMLDQVTMIDAPKVANYERYCKQLTKLIIYNYMNHSLKRKYLVKNKKTGVYRTVEVDFPSIDADTIFDYGINISTELPKNKARIESVVNHIMEMQMQYKGQGIDVSLITPEEWLEFQDLPIKEYMLERMGVQRTQSWTEAVTQIVTEYAALAEQGVNPTDAINAVANSMAQQDQGGTDEDVAEMLEQQQMPNPNL